MAYRNVTNRDSAETYPRRQRAAASPIPASNWLRAGHDVSRSSRLSSEYAHEDGRGPLLNNRDTIHTRVSNGYYLETLPMSPYIGGGSIRFMDGEFGAYHVDDSAVSTRDQGRGLGGGWPESPLLPDASSTLFVEGLPTNCTRREASHIFRHFIGYREVRLVTRHQRHPGAGPLILCFVDFDSPAHAVTAMDVLQGYVFDEDRDSARLTLQFARYSGARVLYPG